MLLHTCVMNIWSETELSQTRTKKKSQVVLIPPPSSLSHHSAPILFLNPISILKSMHLCLCNVALPVLPCLVCPVFLFLLSLSLLLFLRSDILLVLLCVLEVMEYVKCYSAVTKQICEFTSHQTLKYNLTQPCFLPWTPSPCVADDVIIWLGCKQLKPLENMILHHTKS